MAISSPKFASLRITPPRLHVRNQGDALPNSLRCVLAIIVFFGVLGSTGTSADEPDEVPDVETAVTKPASSDFVVNLVVITDDDFLKGDSPSWCFRSLD